MKLSGSYNIPANKQTVWESLNNPEILRQCIPGCDEFTKKTETTFTATATNKIGPFNASFTGEVELKDLNPPDNYKIVGQGNSPVGFASGQAYVELTEQDGMTTLSYTVEANVGGKIVQVGARLIDMTAKKMADIFFGKFSELVTPPEKRAELLADKALGKSEPRNIYIFTSLAVATIAALFILFN